MQNNITMLSIQLLHCTCTLLLCCVASSTDQWSLSACRKAERPSITRRMPIVRTGGRERGEGEGREREREVEGVVGRGGAQLKGREPECLTHRLSMGN